MFRRRVRDSIPVHFDATDPLLLKIGNFRRVDEEVFETMMNMVNTGIHLQSEYQHYLRIGQYGLRITSGIPADTLIP